MSATPYIAEVAAMVGDPSRANMLAVLADGRALTAKELAFAAGVSAPTTSGHLAKLVRSGLLALEKQGRHRYYRIASPLVGDMLEAIMRVAAAGPPRRRPPSRVDTALREARSCYDHLAGRIAVAVTDGLVREGAVVLDRDGGSVTPHGETVLAELGLDLAELRRHRRIFCRPCLDWSERRHHLAGSVGAGLFRRMTQIGWLRPERHSRAVTVTEAGRAGLAKRFGVAFEQP
jgi:DNA-binding transcriptional ArsR family regulator